MSTRRGRSRRRPMLMGTGTAGLVAVLALLASSCVLTGTWTPTAMVAPAPGTGSWVDDVSCAGSSSCLAVTVVTDATTSTVDVQRWDGTAWSTAPQPPIPAGTVAPVDLQLSCGTPSTCALRMTLHRNARWEAHFARWDGSTWHAVPLVGDGPFGPDSAVSCTTWGTCFFTAGSTGAVTWDGATYATISGATTPAMPVLSCVAADACTGFIGRASDAWSWDGATWTPIQGLPQWGEEPEWTDLACTGATDCLAVGTIPPEPHEEAGHPLAARWNGTDWFAVTLPGDIVSLHDVSCADASGCLALGTTYDDGAGEHRLATIGWSGDRWYHAPVPPVPAGGFVTDVGCSADRTCMVGGGQPAGGATVAPFGATYTWE
jgi:hypothetical protein